MRNPDGITTDTVIADLLHYDDPITIITECKFLWQDRYLEKGIATRGGTVYSLTQEGIKARDTLYNPEWIKKMEKEMQEAKENAIPKARIGSKVTPNYFKIPQTPPSPTTHKKRDFTIGSIIITIIVTIIIAFIFSPYFSDFIYPPSPDIHVTDLNAKDGIIEGNKFVYSYEPRTLTLNGTKNEVFTLKISNTGDENASNFWIIVDSKPDGLWFDFSSSAVVDDGNTKSCQQKKSYCTIGLIPKESSMVVEYNVEFDHKLYQEIKDQTPKLLFNYGYDEGAEQTIEVFLKFD